MHAPPCPVCQSATRLLDVVDFTKSCEELRGKYYVPIGFAIYYALCQSCHFCFAPAMHQWTPEDFKRHVYNDDYVIFDPDYREIRPNAQANLLLTNFQDIAPHRTHLDYGSGNGSLSARLRAHGWASTAWDPFSGQTPPIHTLGTFDLITAFEVFEHVPDLAGLMDHLSRLATEHSLILFSTALSDGHIHPTKRLDWWYAAPRNGHISLFSRQSLAHLAARAHFNYVSLSDNFHIFFKNLPAWARHLIPESPPSR